jgi:hypothetical protein
MSLAAPSPSQDPTPDGPSQDRLDKIVEAMHTHAISDERRFGRIEKLVMVSIVAAAVPKLGGPSLDKVVASVLHLAASAA